MTIKVALWDKGTSRRFDLLLQAHPQRQEEGNRSLLTEAAFVHSFVDVYAVHMFQKGDIHSYVMTKKFFQEMKYSHDAFSSGKRSSWSDCCCVPFTPSLPLSLLNHLFANINSPMFILWRLDFLEKQTKLICGYSTVPLYIFHSGAPSQSCFLCWEYASCCFPPWFCVTRSGSSVGHRLSVTQRLSTLPTLWLTRRSSALCRNTLPRSK